MPVLTPQQRAFEAERRRQLRRLATITTATRDRVLAALRDAQALIQRRLAANAGAFAQMQLTAALAAVRGALARFERDGDKAWQQGIGQAFSAGVDLIDQSLKAGSISLAGVGRVDSRQLAAMRAFLTGRIKDISAEAARKIETQLGLVLAGAQTPHDTISAINQILGGGARRRAITITRTELGRAYALAGYERLIAVKQIVPGIKKQWRRSGKVHSRLEHDFIDGQIREIEEPFRVGDEELRFPRDPDASARNTVNCGCTLLPYMTQWKVQTPGRKRFTPEEIARHPERADLNDLIDARAAAVATTAPIVYAGGAVMATIVQSPGGILAEGGAGGLPPRIPPPPGGGDPPLPPDLPDPRYTGLTAAQAATLTVLEARLSRVRRGELSHVVNADGVLVLSRRSQHDRIAFFADEMPLLRGAVLTHNHTTDTTFSIYDIRIAAIADFSEIRVVTASTTYRLRPPPGGWPDALRHILKDAALRHEMQAWYRRLVQRFPSMNRSAHERLIANWLVVRLRHRYGLIYDRFRS